LAVEIEDDRPELALTSTRSRRATLRGCGTVIAALGILTHRPAAAAQASPTAAAAGGDLLLVQGFGQGNLFPTQGDVGVLPYTVVLWDAADRGYFFTDQANGTAGVVATDAVISAIGADGERPRAVLVATVAKTSGSATTGEQFWVLRLGYGGLGSDPGAVTYQGEPLPAEDAATWLETPPAELPDGPQDLGAGYIIIAGLSGFDTSASKGVTLHLR
jgi:hypothetical protein